MKLIKTIRSLSDVNKIYKIYQDEKEGLICTCPSFEFRNYCKHIDLVKGEENGN